MQRIKDEGQDPSKPSFRLGTSPQNPSEKINTSGPLPVSMKNPAVKRSITLKELQAHNTKDRPWFVVDGEVGFVFGSLTMAESWIPGL